MMCSCKPWFFLFVLLAFMHHCLFVLCRIDCLLINSFLSWCPFFDCPVQSPAHFCHISPLLLCSIHIHHEGDHSISDGELLLLLISSWWASFSSSLALPWKSWRERESRESTPSALWICTLAVVHHGETTLGTIGPVPQCLPHGGSLLLCQVGLCGALSMHSISSQDTLVLYAGDRYNHTSNTYILEEDPLEHVYTRRRSYVCSSIKKYSWTKLLQMGAGGAHHLLLPSNLLLRIEAAYTSRNLPARPGHSR